MKEFFLRVLEVLAALVLAGAVLMVYYGVTTGEWHPFMLGVVPLGFVWSMYLGVLAVSNIAMGVFLLLAALVVLAAYLVARFGPTRWFRVGVVTAVFVVQQVALIVLFAMFGVSN